MTWSQRFIRFFWIWYALLAALIMLPLLPPGFILTLDMIFVPHMPLPTELNNTFLLELLLWAATSVVSGDVIQKLILIAIFIGSGVGAHLLMRHCAPKELWAAYFTGMFYMINPFVYSRFMAGQWLVLLGYAFLPFFVRSLLQLIANPSRKGVVRTGLWLTAIGLVSVHVLGIALVAACVGACAVSWQLRRRSSHLKKSLLGIAASIALCLLLHSFWLIPSFLGQTGIAQASASFNDAQFAAFATDASGPFGAVGSVSALQGFWLESRALYALPQQLVPGWIIFVAIIWVLAGIGLVARRKTHATVVLFAALCIIAGIVLAATPLIDWLRGIVPFISGYREPHKFTMLIALGLAILGGLGAMVVAQSASRPWKKYVAGSLLLVPLAITPTLLWGCWGQLKPSHYPADWYAMNSRLNSLPGSSRILFLPWHQYMVFGFTSRIIATPADKFFDKPIIVSDNPELDNIPPTLPNSFKQKVQAALLAPDTIQQLAGLGISHVLVAKEYDYDIYTNLWQQSWSETLTDNDSFTLYKLKSQ